VYGYIIYILYYILAYKMCIQYIHLFYAFPYFNFDLASNNIPHEKLI